jgi:preprotein translocase subunit SecE
MSEEKQGIFKRTGNFFAEVKQEVRKVSWPTRSELYGGTIVIIVVTVILCIGLGGADAVIGKIMETLMSAR